MNSEKGFFILSFYSAFRTSLSEKSWPPQGMPAVHKLISRLQNEIIIDVLFICRKPDDNFLKFKKVKLDELPNVTFHISPYKAIKIKGLRGLSANIFHFLVLLKFLCKKYNFIYCDREQVTPGALFSFFRKKVILRLHGVANFNTKGLFKLGIIPRVKMWAFKARFRKIICSIDGSPGLDFIQKHCCKNTPYHLLYNGVDIINKNSGPAPILEFKNSISGPLFISVGRLDKSKGIDVLIQCLNELKNSSWGLVIIGTGEDKASLLDLVENSGLRKQVLFTGSLSHDEIYACLEIADIFVSFNKYGNQSNAVLEAVKTGKCILTYDSCNNSGRDRQFTSDTDLKEALVLVNAENLKEIKQKLLDLINSSELIKDKEFKMTQYADKNLMTWDERIDKEIELIKGS